MTLPEHMTYPELTLKPSCSSSALFNLHQNKFISAYWDLEAWYINQNSLSKYPVFLPGESHGQRSVAGHGP